MAERYEGSWHRLMWVKRRESSRTDLVSVDRSTSPVNLPAVRPDLSVFPPKAGISDVAFDAEGVSLFARSDVQPNVLHVFNFLPSSNSSEPTSEPAISRLAVLVFSNPIRSARWCFSKRRIAICTKSGGVFFWDGNSGWEEDSIVSADDMSCARGGMMEGVGIPTRTSIWKHRRPLTEEPVQKSVSLFRTQCGLPMEHRWRYSIGNNLNSASCMKILRKIQEDPHQASMSRGDGRGMRG